MKTNVVKNGLRAVMALAAVALATTISSCSAEDFEFKGSSGSEVPSTPVTANAKASVSAVVAFDGKMLSVADGLTVTFNGASADANGTYVLTGSPTLPAQSVEVKAVYQGMSGKATINVPALAAGEGYAVTAMVFINSEENFDFEAIEDPTETEQVAKLSYYNNTGKTVKVPFEYKDIYGRTITDVKIFEEDKTQRELLTTLFNNWNVGKKEDTKIVYIEVKSGQTVNAEAKTTETVEKRALKDLETRAEINPEWLATFTDTQWKTIVDWDTTEGSHDHDPAYNPFDHSHGHGSGNAGGGIIEVD